MAWPASYWRSSRPPPPTPSPIASRSGARPSPDRRGNSANGHRRAVAASIRIEKCGRTIERLSSVGQVRASRRLGSGPRSSRRRRCFGRLAKDPLHIVARRGSGTTLHRRPDLLIERLVRPDRAARSRARPTGRTTRLQKALDLLGVAARPPIGPDADRRPRGDRIARLPPRRDPRRDRAGSKPSRDEVMAPLDEINREIAIEGDLAAALEAGATGDALTSATPGSGYRLRGDEGHSRPRPSHRPRHRCRSRCQSSRSRRPQSPGPEPERDRERNREANSAESSLRKERSAADRRGHGNPGRLHRHAPADRRGRGSRMAPGSQPPAAQPDDGTKPISSRPRRPGVVRR